MTAPNPFSDKDLKKMKEWATSYPYVVCNKDFDLIVAMIGRLEAAEKALELVYSDADYEFKEVMDAWRRAKGETV